SQRREGHTLPAHAERLGRRGWTRVDCRHGKLLRPGGRRHLCAGGFEALYGRRGENYKIMNTQSANTRIRLIMRLRTMGVTDINVLSAIEKVPRDEFVPEAVKDQAWEDTALPIGRGQTISQPLVVASMTAALNLSDRDQVLEIGTGCGYQTAILARLC